MYFFGQLNPPPLPSPHIISVNDKIFPLSIGITVLLCQTDYGPINAQKSPDGRKQD